MRSDDQYTRRSPHVVLQARGAKYPVVHADRRQAPVATVRVMTETRDDAKALIALLDRTSVVMIDVDYAFGVPVQKAVREPQIEMGEVVLGVGGDGFRERLYGSVVFRLKLCDIGRVSEFRLHQLRTKTIE